MCPPIKVEIVFITVTEDWVAVTTRRVHQSDPTLASTKVNRVLPARQPAAVTHMTFTSLTKAFHPNPIQVLYTRGTLSGFVLTHLSGKTIEVIPRSFKTY